MERKDPGTQAHTCRIANGGCVISSLLPLWIPGIEPQLSGRPVWQTFLPTEPA